MPLADRSSPKVPGQGRSGPRHWTWLGPRRVSAIPPAFLLCLVLLTLALTSTHSASLEAKPAAVANKTGVTATKPASTSVKPSATTANGTAATNPATTAADPTPSPTNPATTAVAVAPAATANPGATAAEPAADAPQGASDSTPAADQPQAKDPVTTQAKSPSRAQLDEMVEATAKRHGVELALVKAVVTAESAYDARAVSRAGALGLMQVMPATAADYGIGDRERLFDPQTNLDTGTRHLKRLLTKYKDDYGRAIMAYNAGEGVVDRTGSLVTYEETLSYTEAVIRHYRRQGGAKPTDEAMAKVRQLRKLKGVQAKQLLAKYLDLNLPSLRGNSRTIRVVAPGLDENSAQRRPMIVLEVKKSQD